jgi:ABC-type multidrug transport system fused ATPase/permease subunit
MKISVNDRYILMRAKCMFIKTQYLMVTRSINVLAKRERYLMLAVAIIQVFLSLLDLAGVLIVGLLGSLANTGVANTNRGDRVTQVLEFMNIENLQLQKQVAILGLIAAALLIFKTLASLYFTRRSLYFLSRRSAQLSSILISKLLGQSLLKIQERSMQQTIYALTNGVSTITVGILGTLVYLISDVSLLIILSIGLFVVDTTIAVSTLFIFAIIGVLLYKIMHIRVRQLGSRQAELSIDSSEKLVEVLSSYRELVVRNRRYFYSNQFGKIRLELSNIMAENTFRQNISKYVMEMTIVFGAFVVSAIQFSTNTAPHAIAVLAIFLAASTRIGPAVLRVQSGLLGIKASRGTATPTLEMIESLGSEESIEKVSDAIQTDHPGFVAEIELKNVTFSYPGKVDPAVSNVNLIIKPGSVVAIVGPSGAGKTTLVDLILGVLSPDSGKILVSGMPPLEAVHKWPGALSYVPQDVVITNSTISGNVTMGYPEEENHRPLIEKALEIAQLRDFTSSLKNGIETKVGDRGTSISGGQRQRLGIARAMFTLPNLLILDEATSALDGETEANISDSIQSLKGRVTVVMIAHRLSTVRNVDTVIYMENGKVSATGTFEEVRNQIPNFDRQAKLMGL